MRAFVRLLPAFLAVAVIGQARAEEKPAPAATVLTVPEMECPTCAKKLAAKLALLPGVLKVEPDVDTRTVKVTHKPGETPSPKDLWEASEKGGQVPVLLESPAGKFKAKPAK